MREVTTDRRSLSDVASIVKKSNSKLAELKSELHELESQILLTKGNTVSNGQGKLSITFQFFSSHSVDINCIVAIIQIEICPLTIPKCGIVKSGEKSS